MSKLWRPIHHECVAAEGASESGGEGRFDVIENDEGFMIYNGTTGLYETGVFDTLDLAVAEAQRLADVFDRQNEGPL